MILTTEEKRDPASLALAITSQVQAAGVSIKKFIEAIRILTDCSNELRSENVVRPEENDDMGIKARTQILEFHLHRILPEILEQDELDDAENLSREIIKFSDGRPENIYAGAIFLQAAFLSDQLRKCND